MIVSLNGIIEVSSSDQVIIDVNGVGYGVLISRQDLDVINNNNQVKLYIYEHIREQSYDLYGFLTLDTKVLFEKLLDVNGVGPKMAINILNIGPSEEVKRSIVSGDSQYIKQATGVGQKVAERVIIELKDKLGLSGLDSSELEFMKGSYSNNNDEALLGLISLGYSSIDAARALSKIDNSLSSEEKIKSILRSA